MHFVERPDAERLQRLRHRRVDLILNGLRMLDRRRRLGRRRWGNGIRLLLFSGSGFETAFVPQELGDRDDVDGQGRGGATAADGE